MGSQTKYTPQDLINNQRIYSGFFQLGIDDGWSSSDKKGNFTVMIQISDLTNTPIKNATILDVGCGTGDLVGFLLDKGIKKYSGIDIFAPAIEKARQKYPQYRFIAGDFLKQTFQQKFDFVFCSGALTTKLDTDNYEILTSWIPKMWSFAQKGVGFNFLIENGADSGDLFFYDPNRVFKICRKQIPQAKIESITTSAGMGNDFQELHVFLY